MVRIEKSPESLSTKNKKEFGNSKLFLSFVIGIDFYGRKNIFNANTGYDNWFSI